MTLGSAIAHPQAFDKSTAERCKMMRHMLSIITPIEPEWPLANDESTTPAILLYIITGMLRQETLSTAVIINLLHTISATDLLTKYFDHVLNIPTKHNPRVLLQDRICFESEIFEPNYKRHPSNHLDRHNLWCANDKDRMHRDALQSGFGEKYDNHLKQIVEKRLLQMKRM